MRRLTFQTIKSETNQNRLAILARVGDVAGRYYNAQNSDVSSPAPPMGYGDETADISDHCSRSRGRFLNSLILTQLNGIACITDLQQESIEKSFVVSCHFEICDVKLAFY